MDTLGGVVSAGGDIGVGVGVGVGTGPGFSTFSSTLLTRLSKFSNLTSCSVSLVILGDDSGARTVFELSGKDLGGLEAEGSDLGSVLGCCTLNPATSGAVWATGSRSTLTVLLQATAVSESAKITIINFFIS